MSNLPQNSDDYLDFISLVSGSKYSEEQRKVVRESKNSMAVFADPGTGKTHTVLALIMNLIQMEKIPSSRIRAMSFTNEAVSEMSSRYDSLCAKLRIKSNFNFSTLHSLSSHVLLKNPQGFGLTSLEKVDGEHFAVRAEYVKAVCQDLGLNLQYWQISKLTQAIKSLNSEFRFSRKSVEGHSKFKDLGMEYEDFYTVRKKCYRSARRSGSISYGDLCLYGLDMLLCNPDIAEKVKSETEVLIVDEGQDLSLIQLRFLSLITKRLIIVGDMKQQIHGYAGSCAEIVDWFFNFFPNAVSCELTQSYRNSNKIVNFSKKIILPNKIGGENFKGIDKESDILIKEGKDISFILDEIQESMEKDKTMPYQIMFLYRNNNQEVLLAEDIWRRRLPAYIPKHTNALTVPVVEDLVQLLDLALNPRDISKLLILTKVIPSFKKYKKAADTPIGKLMLKTGEDFFSINYDYEDDGLAHYLISRLQEVYDKNQVEDLPVGKCINLIWKPYVEIYLNKNLYKLENEPDYFLDLVRPLMLKSFLRFKQDEADKAKYFEDQLKGFTEGVKCLTMHGSKGKESDRVTIIEANDALLPQPKKMERLIKMGCIEEAANLLRNERSLLFVASTRARTDLNILYSGEISELFCIDGESTRYQELDNYYLTRRETPNELGAFIEFIEETCDVKILT